MSEKLKANLKKKQPWKFPLMFLLGYLTAWSGVLIDRQMIIEEQHRLQQEINRVRLEMCIENIVIKYNEDLIRQVEWNLENIEQPVEAEEAQGEGTETK